MAVGNSRIHRDYNYGSYIDGEGRIEIDNKYYYLLTEGLLHIVIIWFFLKTIID